MGCTGGYATSDSGNVYTYWRVNVLIHPPLFVSFVIGAPSANHTCSTISLPSANIIHGQYRYIADLLHLATASSHSPYRTWPAYHSPIKMDQLAPFLASHPDQALASYIQMGLLTGFRIGYSRNRAQMRSRNTNHPSALRNKEVVDDKIAAELAAGRLLGPISPHILPLIHTSPLGLVPKAHHTNRWRMICDLSSPLGDSVNDGISPDACSMHYARVDDAVSIIRQLGRGTQMVKIDLKDAYRIVPVHPADYHLLGIRWRGNTYVDRALPFGLRSAPKIFNALADFLAWVLTCQGVQNHLHYLDDFLLLGAPNSQQGQVVRDVTLHTFARLGIPVAPHKTEGPATILVFLGILIDSGNFELRLPADKLLRLHDAMSQYMRRSTCTRQELESLLGHLSHAATVIPQGRVFLRQLFSLLSLDRAPHHYIRFNAGAKADLMWWNTFLQDWNGSSFFPVMSTSIEVFSDASGTFGCGAFAHHHGWFQLQWPHEWHSIHITAKELVPVVIAAALWGHQWSRRGVCFRSDNMAVVDLLKTRTSRDPLLMHMLRCLAFYAAYYRFQLTAAHIPGVLNTAADALSRNNISLFHSLVPQSQQVSLPQAAVDLIVNSRPDWGSQAWTHLFTHSLTRESPQQPRQPISQDGSNTRNFASSST